MMITLYRVFVTGIRNFIRNSWLSIAAIAVMYVATLIVLSAFVLNVTAQNAVTQFSRTFKVSFYLYEDVTQEEIDELVGELEANENVDTVSYVSKQDAFLRFQTISPESNEGLELIGLDALPASLEVSVNNVDEIISVASIADRENYQDVVEDNSIGKTSAKSTIERAKAIKSFILQASVIGALVFGGVSVLIIFNTIRMTIFTRSEEIRIMKLIGATPKFIKGPFLVESSIYGIIAGSMAFATVYFALRSVGSRFRGADEFINESYIYLTNPKTLAIMVTSAIVGVSVGFLSSTLAMVRYLKLKDW